MYWYLFKDFKKQVNDRKLILRYLEKRTWIKIFIALLVPIVLHYICLKLDYDMWMHVLDLFSGGVVGLYIGKKLNDKRDQIYGSIEDYHIQKVILVRNLLNSKSLYNKNKIEVLIQQYEEELPNHKFTTILFKPLSNVMSGGVIPVCVVFLGWLLTKNMEINEGIVLLVSTVALLFFILSMFYLMGPFIGDILNWDYKKMLDLRKLLQDVLIQDFAE